MALVPSRAQDFDPRCNRAWRGGVLAALLPCCLRLPPLTCTAEAVSSGIRLQFSEPQLGCKSMPVGRIPSYAAKPHDVEQGWLHVDASEKVLGRLAARIATVLMGKHKPTFTPHVDTGDFVVVTNAQDVRLTGRKIDEITYDRYSYYPGGWKSVTAREMLSRHPERVLSEAVRRMLPKSALGAKMLKKLKVYAGPEHPHQAQRPQPLEV